MPGAKKRLSYKTVAADRQELRDMPQTERQPAPDRISFSFPADVPGIQTVLHMDGNTQPACYLNETFTIKLIRQTRSTLHFRGKALEGRGGCVGLLDPGEMLRTTRVQIPEIIQGVMIRPDFLARMATELDLPLQALWFRNSLVTHPALFWQMESLLKSLETPSTTLERQSLLAQVLETVLRTTMEIHLKNPRPHNARALVRRAQELIDERFAAPITLDELIAETGLSRCHLMRTFTNEVGVPPHRYQIHLRISRARELLSRGFSPALVATEVGFYDQSHFNNHFKKVVGVTPGQFGQG